MRFTHIDVNFDITYQVIIIYQQESPPVWMQEAYHPLHSKCLLCWGVPHPRSGGYSVWDLGEGGTPSQVWGVPHPRSGVYPIPGLGSTPSQVLGTPSQVKGVPHPRSGGTPSRPGWGVPHPRSGGVPWVPPPIQTWDGVPPQPDLRWGTPLDLGQGTPCKCGQIHRLVSKHYLP